MCMLIQQYHHKSVILGRFNTKEEALIWARQKAGLIWVDLVENGQVTEIWT